jgi:hypothetical protein
MSAGVIDDHLQVEPGLVRGLMEFEEQCALDVVGIRDGGAGFEFEDVGALEVVSAVPALDAVDVDQHLDRLGISQADAEAPVRPRHILGGHEGRIA